MNVWSSVNGCGAGRGWQTANDGDGIFANGWLLINAVIIGYVVAGLQSGYGIREREWEPIVSAVPNLPIVKQVPGKIVGLSNDPGCVSSIILELGTDDGEWLVFYKHKDSK